MDPANPNRNNHVSFLKFEKDSFKKDKTKRE